jgi:hypothetical protein
VLIHGYILRNVRGSSNVSNDIQYLRIYIGPIRHKIEVIPQLVAGF